MQRQILCIRSEYEYKTKVNQLNNNPNVVQYFSIKKILPKLGLYYFVYVNPTQKQIDEYVALKEKQAQQAKENEKLRLEQERQISENIGDVDGLDEFDDIDEENEDEDLEEVGYDESDDIL